MNDILVNVKASTSELKDHGHELIWELNKISPSLLLHIMPELEKELIMEDQEKREDAIDLLGKMFVADGSRMITSYQQLYGAFINRSNDIEPAIRRKVVEYATEFIKNIPTLDIVGSLLARVRDPDESVRSAVVTAICTAAEANPIQFKKDVLQEVGLRMRDKKAGMRKHAMVRLARLYRSLWNRSWTDDERKKIRRAYGWIPTKILHLYFQNDTEIKYIPSDQHLPIFVYFSLPSCSFRTDVDEVVSWELLSADKNVKERTKELLDMLPSFDAHAHQALARLLKDKRKYVAHFCVLPLSREDLLTGL